MDKVVSRTRQVYLPPKPKDEDEAHLSSWKHMMEESRAAEQKRRQHQARARAEREARISASVPIWESSILACPRREWSALVRSDSRLQSLWFQGIPTHLRGRIWSGCIGNNLSLSKESFKACSYRARQAVESGRFPKEVDKWIQDDTANTLPTTGLYGEQGPMTEELRELLRAWYVSRVDEGMGYVSFVRFYTVGIVNKD